MTELNFGTLQAIVSPRANERVSIKKPVKLGDYIDRPNPNKGVIFSHNSEKGLSTPQNKNKQTPVGFINYDRARAVAASNNGCSVSPEHSIVRIQEGENTKFDRTHGCLIINDAQGKRAAKMYIRKYYEHGGDEMRYAITIINSNGNTMTTTGNAEKAQRFGAVL